jgi:hypothetical protein
MERADLLERLRFGRREWDELIAAVPRERMLEPVWQGGWTIKDLVAHVDFYEWWVAEFIRTRDWPVVDPSLQIAELEPRNLAIYELNKDRDLDEVLNASAGIHQGMVDAITGLTDDEYIDKNLLGNPPDDDWSVAKMVEGNTFDHYPQHIPQIREWLSAPTQGRGQSSVSGPHPAAW